MTVEKTEKSVPAYRIEVLKGGVWMLWSQRDSEKGAKIAAANARRSRHGFHDVRVVVA